MDVSRSNGGLRISGWIGHLSCLTISSTSLSVAAFLRRAGGSMLESTGSHGRGVEWRVPEMRCLALTMTTTDTSSSAIAEAMRCFVCVSSINCTIRRAQVPLQIYGCVQLNSVLFSSSRSTTLVVLNTDSLMCG